MTLGEGGATLRTQHDGDVRRVPQFLALVMALLLSGGHVGLLQMTAWSEMLERHLATEGMDAAIADTFDGQHPCSLCCAAAALQEHQDPVAPAPSREHAPQLPQAIPMERLDVDASASLADLLEPTAPAVLGDGVRLSPPVPPPRPMA